MLGGLEMAGKSSCILNNRGSVIGLKARWIKVHRYKRIERTVSISGPLLPTGKYNFEVIRASNVRWSGGCTQQG